MADFNFIAIPELRQSLESDYRELRACLNAESWKAVHVLAGSIVEAVLLDALSREDSSFEKLSLANLVSQAKQEGYIPDEVEDLSTVIRKYRNLIHPGRVMRLEKTVDKSGAIVCAELVEIIARHVSHKKQQTYGYTAEQLLFRLEGGESALPLVPHLLRDTPKHEKRRLLLELLPEACLRSMADPGSPQERDRHLLACYRKVFDAAEADIQEAVTRNLYRVFRTETEDTVITYENCFFRARDLTYLSPSERAFVKAHFLPRITAESVDGLLPIIVGIGSFLEPDEATAVAATLIEVALGDDENLGRRARMRLVAEFGQMSPDSRSSVKYAVQELGTPEIASALEKREAKLKVEAEQHAT